MADTHIQLRNEGVVEFASYSNMKNAIDNLDDIAWMGVVFGLLKTEDEEVGGHDHLAAEADPGLDFAQGLQAAVTQEVALAVQADLSLEDLKANLQLIPNQDFVQNPKMLVRNQDPVLDLIWRDQNTSDKNDINFFLTSPLPKPTKELSFSK
jgi:hypothetical protein